MDARAAVAFGPFMIMLDNTVVNVALSSMSRDLGIVDRHEEAPRTDVVAELG